MEAELNLFLAAGNQLNPMENGKFYEDEPNASQYTKGILGISRDLYKLGTDRISIKA